MLRFIQEHFSAPIQLILVISFSMVAALTIAIGGWAISRTITEYLSGAMNERVARDMQLAQALYSMTQQEITGITNRLAQDQIVIANFQSALQGHENGRAFIDRQITINLSNLTMGGNHLIAVFDKGGRLVAGKLLSVNGEQSSLDQQANWSELAIIQTVMLSGKSLSATEIIPAQLLDQVGLGDQARISILETPKAAPTLYDPRENSAGLALISVSPIKAPSGEVSGVIVGCHLFNNDYTLVDRIKAVAGVDSVTIFLGDLRVSTNVLTLEGERAIGTRISEEVNQVVLGQGKEYIGTAFVVKENYITRYDPLLDHLGHKIGIFYVGARQASFYQLVNNFNERILLVTFGTILLTIILTTPVSRTITRPLNQLKDLVQANRRVAEGDMSVRVPVRAGGEIGELTQSFNTMLDTLQSTQDQLVQSEKLASLGQLAAGVAHELNNPLATILLYADILSNELPPDSNHRSDVNLIVTETKRCKNIVSALLEFARQNQVHAQPTDVNALIEDVLKLEWKRYETTPIQLIHQLDAGLPLIQADQAQLTQVLVNLIENSVDAIQDGGRVTIRTRNGPAGMITIEVEDTGAGISPQHLPKLFTPFFTTKPIGKGTGLGLAIIYGIIKMHRGQISVNSEVNRGTTFIIQLPVCLQGVGSLSQPAVGMPYNNQNSSA
jgi:two-component system NtrC family sensor kinase